MEERDLKIALENYHFFVSSSERVQLEIEELNTKRFKIGGSIARIPENPRNRGDVILENLEKLEKLERRLDYYQINVDLANHFIGSLDEKDAEIVRDKYIRGIASEGLEEKYQMDRKTIWRRIELKILNYVDQVKQI